MKNLLIFLGLFLTLGVEAQYNPAQHTTSNKPIGIAQGVPTDARSYFYDAVKFIYRPYQSVAEVQAYLNLSKYRQGNFPVYISTGALQPNGTFFGGIIQEYMYKDGTANANLVRTAEVTDTTGLSNRINYLDSERLRILQQMDIESSARVASDEQLQSNVDGKQDILLSGQNIKTVNGTSILGTGNLAVNISETDPVFGGSVAKNITLSDLNNWNAKQAALVSGSNIKTINGNSVLGAGDIVISAGASLYTADGSLSNDRTVTSGGNLLTVLGGKEELTNEQIGLRLQSLPGKHLALSLNNVTGRQWKIRSLQSGNFDFRNITDEITNMTLLPNGEVNFRSNIDNNGNGLTPWHIGNKAGILALHMGAATPTTNNYLIYSEGGTDTYVNGSNSLNFRISNSTRGALFNSGNWGFGTNPSDIASALVHLNTTTKGFLLPRLTTTQRNDITSPATGLQVYNTSTSSIDFYNGSAWVALTSGGGGGGAAQWTSTGGNLYSGITQPFGLDGSTNRFDAPGGSGDGRWFNLSQSTIQSNGGINFTAGGASAADISGTRFSVYQPFRLLNVTLTPTSNNAAGNLVYHQNMNTPGYYNGAQWVYFAGVGSTAARDNINSQPTTGMQWYNTTTGTQQVYNGTAWDSGFLPPKMTEAERTAIASPSVGLIVYQTDGTEGVYVNKSTGWVFAF